MAYKMGSKRDTIALCPVRWLLVATYISVVTRGEHGIPFPRSPLLLGVPTSLHQPDYEFSIIKKMHG